MIFKTQGVVFRYTRFGDTSIIVTIFTSRFGLQSYIVNGVRSASSRTRMALFQPLTQLDLVVYHKENGTLFRIKEVKCAHPYLTLHQDVRKSSVAMFLVELLNKSVKDESHAEELHAFIAQSLTHLDRLPAGYENFHLIFMIKLSRLLGFGLHLPEDLHQYPITGFEAEPYLVRLLQCEYDAGPALTLEQRRQMLDLLVAFYQRHVEGLSELKSMAVLKEVLS
jgi:DNA repair protein RecO (recombination protein O)